MIRGFLLIRGSQASLPGHTVTTKLLHHDVTYRIIKAYYTAFNRLSQTYPEYIFERAMQLLVERQGIQCLRQEEYEVRYKGQFVGLQRLDLFIADVVVVELKVADKIQPIHLAQLLSYLKTLGKEVGLLLCFGGPKPAFERRVFTPQTWAETLPANPDKLIVAQGLDHAALIYEIVSGLFEVFKTLGPGYIHRIYANACYHELRWRGLEIMVRREFHVFLDDENLGSIKLGHLQVDSRVLVFPVAESDIASIKMTNLQAWMRHLNVPLGILANFKATRLEPMILRV